jgi:hypothetical protein
LSGFKKAVDYIPPGFPSKLEVNDVGIDKPFKDLNKSSTSGKIAI